MGNARLGLPDPEPVDGPHVHFDPGVTGDEVWDAQSWAVAKLSDEAIATGRMRKMWITYPDGVRGEIQVVPDTMVATARTMGLTEEELAGGTKMDRRDGRYVYVWPMGPGSGTGGFGSGGKVSRHGPTKL